MRRVYNQIITVAMGARRDIITTGRGTIMDAVSVQTLWSSRDRPRAGATVCDRPRAEAAGCDRPRAEATECGLRESHLVSRHCDPCILPEAPPSPPRVSMPLATQNVEMCGDYLPRLRDFLADVAARLNKTGS